MNRCVMVLSEELEDSARIEVFEDMGRFVHWFMSDFRQ